MKQPMETRGWKQQQRAEKITIANVFMMCYRGYQLMAAWWWVMITMQCLMDNRQCRSLFFCLVVLWDPRVDWAWWQQLGVLGVSSGGQICDDNFEEVAMEVCMKTCVWISKSFPGPTWVPILLGGNRSDPGYLGCNGYFALWLEWWGDDAIRDGRF